MVHGTNAPWPRLAFAQAATGHAVHAVWPGHSELKVERLLVGHVRHVCGCVCCVQGHAARLCVWLLRLRRLPHRPVQAGGLCQSAAHPCRGKQHRHTGATQAAAAAGTECALGLEFRSKQFTLSLCVVHSMLRQGGLLTSVAKQEHTQSLA